MQNIAYEEVDERIHESNETTPKILVVDDEKSIRLLLCRILDKNGYMTTMARDTEEARSCLRDQAYELMLCDINMPGESGLALTQKVVAEYPDTAVVMVTGEDDPEGAKNAIEMGSYGYIIKPFEINEIIINVANALHHRMLRIENWNHRRRLEEMVSARTAELKQVLSKLTKTIRGTIQAITLIVESRDPYTAGHQRRVADLAGTMARHLGLSEEQIFGVKMAGNIHDLGKISVPAEILAKPTRLSDAELSIIKNHPLVANDILKDIDFPWPIAQMILQHHEKMNGSGYPMGLSGDEILLESRILAVADVVEAMATHRPYRPALGIQLAMEEISKNKGTLYDKDVVKACVKLLNDKEIVLNSW